MATDIALPVDFEFRVQSAPDGIVLHCKGQITAGETSQAFRATVGNLVSRHPKIIVDLGGIHSLDRRGLELIVSLYSTARTAGATLKYVNLAVPLSDPHHHRAVTSRTQHLPIAS
jgi:anti-anti-sigma regulatory factor